MAEGASKHDPDFLDDASADHSRCQRDGVRTRLRARLLHRSCAELEEALERRHGDGWAEHVLRGDFHAIEGMRRICEAFSLRPELERQVLRDIVSRAKTLQSSRNEAPSLEGEHANCGPTRDAAKKNGDAADSARSSAMPFVGGGKRSRADSEQETVCSTSDGDSIAGTLDGTSCDGDSVVGTLVGASFDTGSAEETLEDGQQLACAGAGVSSSGGSSSECEAGSTIPLRVPWRSRVLRALGIQRVWSGRDVGPSACGAAQVEQVGLGEDAHSSEPVMQQVDEQGDEDQEEHTLSSKLVEAVRNAELQAADARTRRELRRRAGSADAFSSDGLSPLATPFPGSGEVAAAVGWHHQQSSGSKPGEKSVHFARESYVSFFSFHDDLSPSTELWEYGRPLETKVFDGPSGHKAKRTTSAEQPAMILFHADEAEVTYGASWCRSPSESSGAAEDDQSPQEEIEDWEDRCDDIAELMSQQRSCMLWSAAW